MAKDSAEAVDGVRVDKRASVPEDDDIDNLIFLDEEIADAEQRVKDAQAHLDALKKTKKDRS